MDFKIFTQTSLQTFFTIKKVLLSKISNLHILDRFGDHTMKKKIRHTRRHKLQLNLFKKKG